MIGSLTCSTRKYSWGHNCGVRAYYGSGPDVVPISLPAYLPECQNPVALVCWSTQGHIERLPGHEPPFRPPGRETRGPSATTAR